VVKKCHLCIAVWLLTAGLPLAQAEMVVIVHPSNKASLSNLQIARIFMGKLHTYPSGKEAVPVDLPRNNALRQSFSKKILNKNPTQLRSYWSKVIFSGKGFPPTIFSGEKAVKQYVANHPGAIAYIDRNLVDAAVKVLKRR